LGQATTSDIVGIGNRLLLTVREAAAMLAISTRTLWSLTDRGEVPAVRVGRAVRYCIDDLRDWIKRKKGGAA
jgi:excisionase family DNA binding protein